MNKGFLGKEADQNNLLDSVSACLCVVGGGVAVYFYLSNFFTIIHTLPCAAFYSVHLQAELPALELKIPEWT